MNIKMSKKYHFSIALTTRHCGGNLGYSSLKSPFTAHHYVCVQIFEGKRLINILKISLQKTIYDRMLSKDLIENISNTF